MSRKTGKNGVALIPSGEIRDKKSVHTPTLLLLFTALLAIGLINLYTASIGTDYFYIQLKNMFVGLIVFGIFGWVIQARHLNSYAFWIFTITCLLLIAVLILGRIGGGSQRWIVLGPIRGQPGEFAKITVAIIVARYFFLNRQIQAYKLRDLWPVMLMVGLIFALIFPETDFGTAGFCILIAVAQILFIRLDLRSIGIVTVCSLGAGLVGWFFLLKEYQKLRVLNFLNPELDPTGSGYNALQSLVAIGSGGLTGKGFMQGTQTSLQFLPTRHTDFIFSVFAEQHGFWGSSLLFLLFGSITYVALAIARETKDVFNSLLAVGLAAFIFIEFTINIAMVLGIFPVVGLPLPFLSYGGSSLLSMCVIMGILVAIDRANISRTKKPMSLERAAVK